MLSLTVNYNGESQTLHYTFTHDVVVEKRGKVPRHVTRCFGCTDEVFKEHPKPSKEWSNGISCTAPEDFFRYNRKFGNQLAFWRMLRKLYPVDRNIRKAFMTEYINKHGLPVKKNFVTN